jgi:hypothetical protein
MSVSSVFSFGDSTHPARRPRHITDVAAERGMADHITRGRAEQLDVASLGLERTSV